VIEESLLEASRLSMAEGLNKNYNMLAKKKLVYHNHKFDLLMKTTWRETTRCDTLYHINFFIDME